MKFLHYLIVIPLLAAAVWAVYTADPDGGGIPYLWYSKPFDTKLVLLVFLAYGYLMGRIGAWFNYSPLRADLRRQKKANKVLNKEQAKLNETVSGLKQDLAGWEEKAKKDAQAATVTESKGEVNAWWSGFKQKIANKKGN